MSTKNNRAGKQQPYVPAGNGDESGEYREYSSNGSNTQDDYKRKIDDFKFRQRIKNYKEKNNTGNNNLVFSEIQDIDEAKKYLAKNYKNVQLHDLDDRVSYEVAKSLKLYEEKYPGLITKEIKIKSNINILPDASKKLLEIYKDLNPNVSEEALIQHIKKEKKLEKLKINLKKGFGTTIHFRGHSDNYVYSPVGVSININEFNPNVYNVGIKKIEDAFQENFFTTNTFKGIVDHEIGHYLTNRNIFNKIYAKYGFESNDSISKNLSDYPTTYHDKKKMVSEIIAEGWAEYINNKNPREWAKDIAKTILEEYGYGK